MNDLTSLQVLSLDSVNKLRSMVAMGHGSRVWTSGLDVLVGELDLDLVDTEYKINPDVELRHSDDVSPDRELDAANARRMLQALPSLTLADAIDERMWVTLALGRYHEYTLSRWPLSRSAIGNHIQNHVFATAGRGRVRDQAIARLWWSGAYVQRFMPSELIPVLKGLFSNSDIPVQLHAGRPNISSIPSVAKECLDLIKKHFADGDLKYNRPAFRGFLEDLDFQAGRRALGLMDDRAVREIVNRLFQEHFPEARAI